MTDIIIESSRFLIVLMITFYLYRTGDIAGIRKQRGWSYIIGGFGLLLFGMLMDITDNFHALNKFVIIGETPAQAFLEKVIGYLAGSALLAMGFVKWIPSVVQMDRTKLSLKEAQRDLETRILKRTSELKEANRKLEIEKAKARTIYQVTPSAIFTVDKDKTITSWNDMASKITGYSKEEIIGQKCSIFALSPCTDKCGLYCDDVPKPVLSKTCTIRKKNGELRTVEKNLQCLIEGDCVVGGIESFQDITERLESENAITKSLKEKEMLIREIHHRVKNNLQIISSLLSMQARGLTDEKSRLPFMESENRVRTMSKIHEMLYNSGDFLSINTPLYVSSLATQLMQSFRIDKSRVSIQLEVENIPMGINTMIPFGLILNELISNALKYAFPDNRMGELKISFHDQGDDMRMLSVKDNGAGLPDGIELKSSNSLGMNIIKALTSQINGALCVRNGSGVTFSIIFREEPSPHI